MAPRNKFARCARKKPGKMNITEEHYAAILENKKRAGIIHEYHYEAMTLKIGDGARYTPDFMVIMEDTREIEFHEVKGSYNLDPKGLVKIRVASMQFPFIFRLCRLVKGQWDIHTIGE